MGFRFNSEDFIPNNDFKPKGSKKLTNAPLTSFNDLPDQLKERLEKCAKQVTDLLSDRREAKVD